MIGIDWSSNAFEEIPDTPPPEQPAAPTARDASHPVLDPAAYYGLAGEIVARILPHTESCEAALLLQYLTYFGNAIDRGPHYLVEQTQHFANLFVTLVGHAKAHPPSASAPSSILPSLTGRASASSAACRPVRA
jgi:hypothetical protein